jgi:CPA2 family monovalent cation:H+ antiporter-2
MFAAATWLAPRLDPRRDSPQAAAAVPEPIRTTDLTDHTIVIGYGRVGALVGDALKQRQLPFLVAEVGESALAKLKQGGIETVMGNAAQPEILGATNPSRARHLVIAIPEAFEAGQIVQQARAANPDIRIIARAHADAEVDHLKGLGADVVIMGEREIARGMIEELERRVPDAAQQDPRALAVGSVV